MGAIEHQVFRELHERTFEAFAVHAVRCRGWSASERWTLEHYDRWLQLVARWN
jgi:hypothetical protein